MKKNAICAGLTLMVILALAVLCADEAPDQTINLKVFFGLKLGALAILYVCVKIGKYCESKGLMPDFKDSDEIRKEE